MDPFLLFMYHVCLFYTIMFVPCSLVITCWERTDLLVFLCVCDVSLCFRHFFIGCLALGVVLDCIDFRSLSSLLVLKYWLIKLGRNPYPSA